ELGRAHSHPARTQKEGVRVAMAGRSARRALDQSRPHVVAIAERPAHCTLADRDQPILLALAFTDEERPALGIEIRAIESDELHAPDTGRVEDFDDRAVAEPE